jgi:prephenate dehydrogenase
MKVGMIGFGRLGRLIAKNLSQDADLLIYDVEDYQREIDKLGAKPAQLREVCECPIVIPFVPMSALEELLKEMAPLLKKDTLVIDVCSVKSMPVNWMKENLPDHVSLLGTHPMFGPDSAKNTLFGCKIVTCPVRLPESQYQEIKAYLETHGLKVIEATPEEHDKQIAHSLLLTHFLGRTLMDFEAKSLPIDTKGYRRLMKILETVENDSWQLFEDMNKYNPYAEETRHAFIKSMASINDKVQK